MLMLMYQPMSYLRPAGEIVTSFYQKKENGWHIIHGQFPGKVTSHVQQHQK